MITMREAKRRIGRFAAGRARLAGLGARPGGLLGGAMILSLALASAASRAQSPAESDPPARVGRIAYVAGQVAYRAAGESQWSEAAINYPLTNGDGVWTEPDAHAVVEIGPSEIRLAGGTELELDRVDFASAALRLPQGSVDLRLSALPEGERFQLATPRGTVTLLRPGLYRIDAGSAAQPTEIAAFEGAASFQAAGSSVAVQPGQAVAISGKAVLAYVTHPAVRAAIDNWAAAQDARLVEGQAARYVSPETTGYQDLDPYGSWRATPEYGPVWYPRSVPLGWVPYRDGRWAWVAPWGWTWIDDAPWGFAPFHYGRWIFRHERWAWVPGRYRVRPVYAPALVAFVGAPSFAIAVAGGTVPAIGWIPLGPDEVFVPSYRASPRYLRALNIADVREAAIERIASVGASRRSGMARLAEMARPRDPDFANRHALTIVRRADFVAAHPVQGSAFAAQPGALKLAAFDPESVPPRPPPSTSARAGRREFRGGPHRHEVRALRLAPGDPHHPSAEAIPRESSMEPRAPHPRRVHAERLHRERERTDVGHRLASLPPERRPLPEHVPEHRPAALAGVERHGHVGHEWPHRDRGAARPPAAASHAPPPWARGPAPMVPLPRAPQ
jgi:hypothetical protein